jgi:cytochrome P450
MDATTDDLRETEETQRRPGLFGAFGRHGGQSPTGLQVAAGRQPVLAIEGTGDPEPQGRHRRGAAPSGDLHVQHVRGGPQERPPADPLQIDPPEHKKYRKLLDPIFAPRLMTAMEEEVAVLVNDLIDRFIDRGEVDFAAEFSVPYPLAGLPHVARPCRSMSSTASWP